MSKSNIISYYPDSMPTLDFIERKKQKKGRIKKKIAFHSQACFKSCKSEAKCTDLTYCADESKWLQESWEIIKSRKTIGECACRDDTEPGTKAESAVSALKGLDKRLRSWRIYLESVFTY